MEKNKIPINKKKELGAGNLNNQTPHASKLFNKYTLTKEKKQAIIFNGYVR